MTQSLNAARLKLWWQKWRYYEHNRMPWNRLAIQLEAAKRGVFIRTPVEGNVLQALREGRLEIGEHTLLEPGCWLTMHPETARIRIGKGVFINKNVMIAAAGLVEIGDYTMIGNGSFISDSSHGFDDPELPITAQGFTSKGATRVGSNCWLGVNVAVTSGVTIGDRCVVGANSVVTKDVPTGSIAVGAPAKVISQINFGSPQHAV